MIDLVWTFLVVTSGKPGREVEAHLVAEHRQRAGAGAVGLAVAVVADVPHEVEVLAHGGGREGSNADSSGTAGAPPAAALVGFAAVEQAAPAARPCKACPTMHSPNQFDLLRERRFAPFFWTQFLGAGNDNVYKNALIIFVAFQASTMTTLDPNALVNLAGAVFIAPFVLLSATSGQLADKVEKSRLIRWIKLFEIAIMAIGLRRLRRARPHAAVRRARADGRPLDAVRPGEVRDPAAASEARGAHRRQRAGRDGHVRGDPAGHDRRRRRRRGAARRARRSRARSRSVSPSPATSSAGASRSRRRSRRSSRSTGIRSPRPRATSASRRATGSSGCRCWASPGSGSTARSSSPSSPASRATSWAATKQVVTFLLALFSIGIGAGSLLCERLSGRRVELGLVPFGSIGLSLFAIDLWLSSRGLSAHSARRAGTLRRAAGPLARRGRPGADRALRRVLHRPAVRADPGALGALAPVADHRRQQHPQRAVHGRVGGDGDRAARRPGSPFRSSSWSPGS